MNNDWREYTGDLDYYMMHHGIKGQHWGVRRFESESGHLTPAGQARYNTVDGKYQKLKSAKAAKSSALKSYNKDFAKAYHASQRLNLSKKRKADRDAKIEQAYKSGEKADKAVSEYKKAKTDYKFEKRIAANDAERDKIMAARKENRAKIKEKGSKDAFSAKAAMYKAAEGIYKLNGKAYANSKNKTLASMNKSAENDMHKKAEQAQKAANAKKQEKMQAKLKDFDEGSKIIKSGYDKYSKTLSKYRDAKISSIGNSSAKKTDAYKSAKKDYVRQQASDLVFGKTYTKVDYMTDAAKKKKK